MNVAYGFDHFVNDLRASTLPFHNDMASIATEIKKCEASIGDMERTLVQDTLNRQCPKIYAHWFHENVPQRHFVFPVHEPIPMSHVNNALLRRFRSMLFHHPLLLKGWSLYATKRGTSSWFQATRPLIKEVLESWEDYEYLVLGLYEPSHLASISYEMAHVFDATFGSCMQVGTTACV